MKKLLIPLGIILVVAAAIWNFGLSKQFTPRFKDGWKWEVNTLGTVISADEASGQFPEGTTPQDDPISITTRTIIASTADAQDGTVKLSDHFLTTDPATNAVTWEFTFEAEVDAKTGRYTTDEYADDYFLFPPNAEKTTYRIRNSSYQGVPMDFTGEEEISGINTYVYAYEGDLVNTAAYSSWLTLEAGQTVICYDFEMRFWVEPTTGEVVKYREWCPGDYVVEEASSERLYGLQRWTGETTGDDLVRRADEVKSDLTRHNLYKLYLPLALLVSGIVMGGAGVVIRLQDNKEQLAA